MAETQENNKEMGKRQYPSDLWTLEIELLGFKHVGDELALMAAYAEPPFAIGVFGKWGSGKTSLLRYAMAKLGGIPLNISRRITREPYEELKKAIKEDWEKLQNEKPIIPIEHIKCVWFNPWQYQNEPNPLISLLHEIHSQMSSWVQWKSKGSKILHTSMESGIELLGHLIDGAAKLSIGVKLGVGKVIPKIREYGERYEREHFETLTDSQRFSLLFEQAVLKLLPVESKETEQTGSRRLVIFIDDLDRCEDEQIIYLLEAIKLYLSTNHCVFVLGLDAGAVERALKRKNSDKSIIEIREYMEKLIQGVIHVPICRNYTMFIVELFKKTELPETSNILTGKKKTIPANIDTVFPDYPSNIQELIVNIIEPNPRKIKNFITTLRVAWLSLKKSPQYNKLVENNAYDFSHVVLLVYLKVYYPDVYRSIEHDPSNLIILRRVFFELKDAIREHSPLSSFYAHCFSHVLQLDQKTSSEKYEHSPYEHTLPDDLSPEQLITIIKRGHAEISDTLDRHNSDKKFKQLFSDCFDDNILNNRTYLLDLIKPFGADEVTIK